jgi:hypothetical protein
VAKSRPVSVEESLRLSESFELASVSVTQRW